ncbi:MAG: sugar ABC transporter permease [Epulopiscium sp.]|nr:sugar ABC transporter permease [Candidatus Epulonipiscium sp.]
MEKGVSMKALEIKQKRGFSYFLKRDWMLYLIIAIPIIHTFIFKYCPMGGIVIAFKQFNPMVGIFKSDWVGLKYFKQFLNDSTFWNVFRNTILLSLYNLLWSTPMPIIFALTLNEVRSTRFKKSIQTISYLPYFVSTVVMVGIIFQVLSPTTGIVNHILRFFNIEPIMFMGESKWFRTVYITSGIWQGTGYSAIMYFAALTNIDQELYEAAQIDGAGRWSRMVHITIPGIMPIIAVMLLLNIGNILQLSFEKVILMQKPITIDVAEVINSYVYKRGLVGMDYSYGTAVGLLQSVISFTLLVVANKASKKLSETSLW